MAARPAAVALPASTNSTAAAAAAAAAIPTSAAVPTSAAAPTTAAAAAAAALRAAETSLCSATRRVCSLSGARSAWSSRRRHCRSSGRSRRRSSSGRSRRRRRSDRSRRRLSILGAMAVENERQHGVCIEELGERRVRLWRCTVRLWRCTVCRRRRRRCHRRLLVLLLREPRDGGRDGLCEELREWRLLEHRRHVLLDIVRAAELQATVQQSEHGSQ